MVTINKEVVKVTCYDGFELNAYIYGDYKKEFKGVVQLVHGISEHSGNYNQLIDFLLSNSYIVVIHDHRGHGKYNENQEIFSYRTNESYFGVMVKDLKSINTFIRNKFIGKKLFLIGHSMGGYLSLKYSEVYGDSIDGLVLSGIGRDYKLSLTSKVVLTRLICGFRDVNKPNEFLSKTFFKVLNRKFRKGNKKCDDYAFTTSDESVLERYSKDELRVKEYTLKFYHDLFDGIENSLRNENLNKIKNNLKVLIVAGKLDPVCSYERGVKYLNNSLIKRGIDSKFKLYDNMRHEIFVEKENTKVFYDIIEFIDKL